MGEKSRFYMVLSHVGHVIGHKLALYGPLGDRRLLRVRHRESSGGDWLRVALKLQGARTAQGRGA